MYRHDLAQLTRKFNSPTWQFDDPTLNETAAAFDNPDYVSIVIDNYPWRQAFAPTEPRPAAELPTGSISPATTPTGRSLSVTTCRRKVPANSPKP